MKELKKEKIKKRINRKHSLKKFIDSGYTDVQAFLGACKNDEDLLIYTCLEQNELDEYLEKLRNLPPEEDKIKYLVNNQPFMNTTIERYNRCVESIAKYLKGYIAYNGYVLCNRQGNAEDWGSTFWLKFCKICEFYRVRWFYPEKLEKKSTVVYNPLLYKEFLYICRSSITSERKYLAFLATQDLLSSVFDVSIDSKISGGKEGEEKSIGDAIPDKMSEISLVENANLDCVCRKALNICKGYNEGSKYYNQIESFYEKQDASGFDKKVVILGKIFLYKAGLVSPKILSFIKGLSNTYKVRYNLSTDRVLAEMKKFKMLDRHSHKTDKKEMGWRDIVFKKRGEWQE